MPVLPLVSVIVVVRNEAARIRDCLQQIVEQDYPRDLIEIVVVDGESEDGTGKIVEAFDARGIPLRLRRNRNRGRAAGLNAGIAAAAGNVIARVDARTVLEPEYLRRCVQALEESGADNVGGILRPLATTSLTQRAIALAMSHPFGVGDAQFRLGRQSGFVDTVYPGCFRREVFGRVGLFDEEAPVISEDSDLNYRIRQTGGRVYLDTRIVVKYEARDTLGGLWRLYFRYGGARAGTLLKHGRLFSVRQGIPPAFVLALLGLILLSPFYRAAALALVVVVCGYLLAAGGVAAALAAAKAEPRLFGRLALAFMGMHLGWGLGFWRRLLQRPRPGTYWGN